MPNILERMYNQNPLFIIFLPWNWVAYQYTLNKTILGLRPKLLFGISNIHTTQSEINFNHPRLVYPLQRQIQANTYYPWILILIFREAFIAGLFKNVGIVWPRYNHQTSLWFGNRRRHNDWGLLNGKCRTYTRASFQTNDTGSFAADGNIYFNGLKITMQELVNGNLTMLLPS